MLLMVLSILRNVIGVLVLVAGIVILTLFLLWRRKNHKETSESAGSEMTQETEESNTTSITGFSQDWIPTTTEESPMFTAETKEDDFSDVFEETWG